MNSKQIWEEIEAREKEIWIEDTPQLETPAPVEQPVALTVTPVDTCSIGPYNYANCNNPWVSAGNNYYFPPVFSPINPFKYYTTLTRHE